MSKRSRRGNDFAPSTFPFLAVLLCVIGALILLLVINVTNSRASATKQVQSELSEAIEQAKERSDYLVSISEELKARREQVKKQIESRRSELARTEDHIKRLEEQLQEAIDRLKSLQDASTEESQSADKIERIESLKAMIDEERKKLTEKIQERKDQTPAFSIIPYEGANRTTRRPVYLECTQDGVIIQPEGVLISMEDLGPPHGPGNPLDAALRVLRTAYQARDAVYGITIPPYPLLIVRPDGIHSYALARSAMSGWDDQFGYELIEAEMPLVFPEGVPELKNELAKTLAVAKDRQRALVAALPARFSRNPFATKSDNTWDSIDAESANPRSKGSKEQDTGENRLVGDVAQDGRRWKMIQELPPGISQGTDGAGSADGKSLTTGSGTPGMTFENSFENSGDQLAQSVAGQSLGGAGRAGGGQAGGGQAGNAQGQEDSSAGSATNANGNQREGSLTASSSGSNSASNRFSSASSGAAGGASNAAQSAEDAQMEQAVKEQAMKEQDAAGATFKPKGSSKTSNAKSTGSDSELKPISLTAGKDWATTRMDNKSTPVSRPIRIIVLEDRWLMCREGQDWKYDAEILLEQGPQLASEQLQQAIRDRVDSWGLSLPGGYWVPSLTVQAAADADQSVQRLQKLLEGSGVVIKVQPLKTPGIRK